MSKNDHIIDYLKFYLSSDVNFAVLLTGKWGCGKTWFIKSFINDYQKEILKSNKSKFLYVTLNGNDSIADIEDQIFQQLHPVLSKKGVSVAGSILKNLAKEKLKIDLSVFEKLSRASKDVFLIFDDLERCMMPLEKTLGIINYYVETLQRKVIILSNEEEISDENFKQWKEKVIGRSFAVKAEFTDAFKSFIEKTNHKEILQKSSNAVIEVFQNSKSENLRVLQQTVWDFDRFINFIEKKFLQKEDFVKELLKRFFIYSIEMKLGHINLEFFTKSLQEKLTIEYMIKNKAGHEKTGTPASELVSKYQLSYDENLLTEQLWADYFQFGIISVEEIRKCLDATTYYEPENRDVWVKLWWFGRLTDDKIIPLINELENRVNKREYKDPDIALHVCGILIKFQSLGFYSNDNLVEYLKSYLRDISASSEWCYLTDNKSSNHLPRDGSFGLGWTAGNTTEFGEINSYLSELVTERKLENLKVEASQLIETIKTNPEDFFWLTHFSNSTKFFYWNKPVLSFINPEEFFSAFCELENAEKHWIELAFEKRYQPEIPKELEKELNFLKELRKLIESRSKEMKLVSLFWANQLKITVDKSIKNFKGNG
ncbi:AAA family ATPase [bacterium]|nr:AAA family ATPase [bacterium]